MKRTYEHEGWHPYGAGEMWIADSFVDPDFFGNVTEEILKYGTASFTTIDDTTAFLTLPDGMKIEYVRR